MDQQFSGTNVPVLEVAKILNKDPQYVRQGIIKGLLPIGVAFKREGSSKYDYYISPKLLYEFTGVNYDAIREDQSHV